jgi:hypothetical protein
MTQNPPTITIKDRINRGMERLNSYYGDEWINRIDLDTLDIGKAESCILGQLEGGYHRGMAKLNLNNEECWLYGFSGESIVDGVRVNSDPATWRNLQTAWILTLKSIRRHHDHRNKSQKGRAKARQGVRAGVD